MAANAWRAQYEMSPLVWDNKVATVAQAWADQLAATMTLLVTTLAKAHLETS